MAIAKVFKNRIPNCRAATPTGRIIIFTNGQHITTYQPDIDYLEGLVAEGSNPYIYIDEDEKTVDTDELSVEGRIKKLKREAVEEYLATVATASASTEGTKQTGELGAGTSANLINAIQSNGAAAVASPAKVVAASAPAAAKVVPGAV